MSSGGATTRARERNSERVRVISSRCAADALEKLTGLQLHSTRQHKSREFMLDRARCFFCESIGQGHTAVVCGMKTP